MTEQRILEAQQREVVRPALPSFDKLVRTLARIFSSSS
jgi:hypothetical protein